MATVDVPGRVTQWVDGNGYPTRWFYQFVHDLWRRTGGSTDLIEEKPETNIAVFSDLLSIRQQIADLQNQGIRKPDQSLIQRIEALENRAFIPDTSLRSRIEALENQAEVLGLINTRLPLSGGVLHGDLYWKNEGNGLIFGSMYIGSALTVTIADTNRHEVLDGTSDGWTAGKLNQITFPTGGTEHYLTITVPGKYLAMWSLDVQAAATAGSIINGGLMIDGTAQTADGEIDVEITNTVEDSILSTQTIIDCPNGDEEISLWISNDGSSNVTCNFGNLTLIQIGGT